MKKLSRIFAIVMAAMLMLTGIGPVNAEAAEIKLNTESRTIYAGGSSVYAAYSEGTYTLKLKNKASSYSVSWSSSDESVATVTKLKAGKATVTAIKPGKATITANYYNKVTKVRTELTCKITVKMNCAAVDISPATAAPMEIGDTLQLKGTMYSKAAKVVTSGKEVTDLIRWTSSDTKVATVSDSGKVKAVGAGKAVITCYTIQTSSGTYSKLAKATAKDTINITVNEPPKPAIDTVALKSLNSFEIKFAQDFSKSITAKNLKLTTGDKEAAIASISFDRTGLIATVVTEKELTDKSIYTVELVGTEAKANLTASFKVDKGYPASMDIYTELGGNTIIAGIYGSPDYTRFKFRLYNADGVDITPIDENSAEYLTHKSNIKYTLVTSGMGFIPKDADYIYCYNEDKSMEVKAEYTGIFWNEGVATVIAFATNFNVYSVKKAYAVTYAEGDAIVTDMNAEGSKLPWDEHVNYLSMSDNDGYRLVVRVKNQKGEYEYSNATPTSESSRITFSMDSYSASIIGKDGVIHPYKIGTDTVAIKYGDVIIGYCDVNVVEKRQAAVMEFTDSNGIPTDLFTTSDRTDVCTVNIGLKVYDQYGDILKIKPLSAESDIATESVKIESIEAKSAPYGICHANTDGTGRIVMNAPGYGAATGKDYTYKVTYTNPSYGTITGYFTINVITPQITGTVGYELSIDGNTDVSITAGMTEIPSLSVNAYELRNGIRYSKINNILASVSSIADGNYMFRLYKADTGEEYTGYSTLNKINTMKVENGVLKKLPVGEYIVKLIKRVGSNYNEIAATTFTVTDTQSVPYYEPKKNAMGETIKTTAYSINSSTDKSIMKLILSECFTFKLGSETVSFSDIDFADDPFAAEGVVLFRSVKILQKVRIGSTDYNLEHRLQMDEVITTRK